MNNKCDKSKLSQKDRYFGHNTFPKFTVQQYKNRTDEYNLVFFFT